MKTTWSQQSASVWQQSDMCWSEISACFLLLSNRSQAINCFLWADKKKSEKNEDWKENFPGYPINWHKPQHNYSLIFNWKLKWCNISLYLRFINLAWDQICEINDVKGVLWHDKLKKNPLKSFQINTECVTRIIQFNFYVIIVFDPQSPLMRHIRDRPFSSLWP